MGSDRRPAPADAIDPLDVVSEEPPLDDPRVLIVDDDPRLRVLLERYLDGQGFTTRSVPDGKQMDAVLESEPVDVIILDLMLPGEDGLSICRRLRASENDVPVLMLTAKGDDVDRIVGLELGADDYLAKPCNPRELAARLKAILRRRTRQIAAAPDPEGGRVSFGPFTLDLTTRKLERDGAETTLTSGEFSLLKVLVTHPFQPLSREQLMVKARGRLHEAFDRSIDVQVSRLRKLLKEDGSNARYIQTVWGVGYVFVPSGETGDERRS